MEVASDDARIGLRAGVEADYPLVYASWLKSYRRAPANRSLIRAGKYFDTQKLIIARLLERGFVMVLCNADNPTQIYGYVVGERRSDALIIHWLWVKWLYRRMGLARKMLDLLTEHLNDDMALLASHVPAGDFFKRISTRYPITFDPSTKE